MMNGLRSLLGMAPKAPYWFVPRRMMDIDKRVAEELGLDYCMSYQWKPHPSVEDLGRDLRRHSRPDLSKLSEIIYNEDDALTDTRAAMMRNMKWLKRAAFSGGSVQDRFSINKVLNALEWMEQQESLRGSGAPALMDGML